MISKHIQHLAIVSLKFFFDFDYTHCRHMLAVIFLVAGIIKLLFYRFGQELTESVTIAKRDLISLKEDLEAVIDNARKEDKSTWENIAQYMRVNLLNRDAWTWKIK